MKRLFFVGISFLAVSCAHQPIVGTGSVRVSVTASPEASRQFGAGVFERMTQLELGDAVAPSPRPLSLTVRMEATDRLRYGPTRPTLASGRTINWKTIFDRGEDSVYTDAEHRSEGLPAVPVALGKFGVPVVVGTYTISDNAGMIREHQPIVILGPALDSRGAVTQLQSLRMAARYLANRVVAVDSMTHLSGHRGSL